MSEFERLLIISNPDFIADTPERLEQMYQTIAKEALANAGAVVIFKLTEVFPYEP